MLKTILNYLLGLLIFLLYPCGLVVIAYLLIKDVTNSLSRNMTGSDFLLALFILLATTVLLPLGTLRVVRKLRENGKEQVVHGMFLGLVLLVAYALIKGEIRERREKKLEIESKAQDEAFFKEQERLNKELEETRKQLRKEAQEQ